MVPARDARAGASPAGRPHAPPCSADGSGIVTAEAATSGLQPMATFDPSRPCLVYDELNDELFAWQPEWQASYLKHVTPHCEGVVSWDGLLLAGWRKPDQGG